MVKSCAQCASHFEVDKEDLEFLSKVSPSFSGKLHLIPHPTLCPSCRFQRRTAHRNESNLYARTCDYTGRPLISIFHPKKSFPVYNQATWWSDCWDPKDYGREVDFTKPFFEQWRELRNIVPRIALLSKNSENSEYTNHAVNNRDCYLSTIIFNCEDVYYSRKVLSSRSVIDSAYIFHEGELLYDCFWSENLYNSKWCAFCSSSSDLTFCFDCRGCSNCFMSSNLRNKSYVLRNEQLSKEKYTQLIKEIYLGSYETFQGFYGEFEALKANCFKPALRLDSCEDVRGDFLLHSKNVHECYYATFGEDCRYCVEFDSSADNRGSRECMDCFGFGGSELLYEVQAQANGYNNRFCSWSYDVSDSFYLDMCFNVQHCFGCVGLHDHETHCILNKEYSKDEYEDLVSKIIHHMGETGEWGEFFPAKLSPFGYNESAAMEYFPLSKEEALVNGFEWSNYQAPKAHADKEIDSDALPDKISDTPDEITLYAIRCKESGKLFRITTKELQFYRANDIPLPRLSPEIRRAHQMTLRNPLALRKCSCAKCNTPVDTTFAEGKDSKILCEGCYNTVIG